MIIFFESGRLGNQLFQYCALKKIDQKGSVYLIGMRQIKTLFQGIELPGGAWLERAIEYLIRRLGYNRLAVFARKTRLIGLIEEHRSESYGYSCKYGLLKNVLFCDMAYFQRESMIDDSIARGIEIRPDVLDEASKIFSNFLVSGVHVIFVHVRRGDYVCWPSASAPAVLPLSWYLKQMNLFRSLYGDVLFFLLSDDKPYVEEMFGDRKDVFISYESEEVDFALMTMCSGGILSPSSFSWWGAYFARRTSDNGLFVAPLYWAGHRTGVWFPEGIETSWLRYEVVN